VLDQPGGPASAAIPDADTGRGGRISDAGRGAGWIIADTRASGHRNTATGGLALAGAEMTQLRTTAFL
jgi:hypothetical protein